MDAASICVIAVAVWLITVVAMAMWFTSFHAKGIDTVLRSQRKFWGNLIQREYIRVSDLPEDVSESDEPWTAYIESDRWGDLNVTVKSGDQEIDIARPEVIIAMINASNRYYGLTGNKRCLSTD